MKVSVAQLKKLYTAMGFDPTGWDTAKVTEYATTKWAAMLKAKNVKVPTDKNLLKLQKDLTAAAGKVEVSEDGADAQLAKATAKAPAAKAKAAPAAPAGSAGAAEPAAEGAPAKPKGKKIEKAGGDKGPGVIGSIVEFLQTASEQAPESKESLADKLVARFPDRDRDSMMKTVSVQVPNRIEKEKGLKIERARNEGRMWYWIDVVPAGKPAGKGK